MTNKAFEAIKIALENIDPRAKNLIIVPEGFSCPKGNKNTIVLQHNFNIEDAIVAIANIKYVGIINAELFNRTKLSELINILTNANKSTVIRLNASPVSCKIFYPSPKMGIRYIKGNYEYSYCQSIQYIEWKDVPYQNGWGVRIIDKSQTEYECPLTTIQGYPVNSMAYLFYYSQKTVINLINWDTSNVTNMGNMFEKSQATNLDLSSFDTSSVTRMDWMFNRSQATSLDLSSFNTFNVTDMGGMFARSKATSLDLSKFNTSKVTDMSWMFDDSQATSLDVSNFDTSNAINMGNMFSRSKAASINGLSLFDTSKVMNMSYMFYESKSTTLNLIDWNTSNVTDMSYMFFMSQVSRIDVRSFDTSKVINMRKMFNRSHETRLDLSSFDTSNTTEIDDMFTNSKVKSIIARTKIDADKYKASSLFPYDITMETKP